MERNADYESLISMLIELKESLQSEKPVQAEEKPRKQMYRIEEKPRKQMYRVVSLSVPTYLLVEIKKLGTMRRCEGRCDYYTSSIIRDALLEYFKMKNI